MFPMTLNGVSTKEAKKKARELICKVGLNEKILKQYPQMMSGGEQQRVAIARAMASGGNILLADEPTGNLDTKNEILIVNLLKDLAHKDHYVVIIVTHNPNVALETDEILRMQDGLLIEVQKND